MRKHHRGGDGRVVLITGGSRGIGRVTAERLARNGWRVFAAARDAPSEPTAESGDAVVRVHADVRDPASIEGTVGAILTMTSGRLDAVVANAGIAAVGTFEDTPADVMSDLMKTNYFGVLNTARAALPALRASHGRLVVVSSDSGVYGSPGLSGYSASKFAVEGWAESVYYELRRAGVRVSIVRPGAFRTTIWQSQIYGSNAGPSRELAQKLASNWRAAADRAADPAVVAGAVERALADRSPRLRYTVGRDARTAVALRRACPDAVFARVVERWAGLSRDR